MWVNFKLMTAVSVGCPRLLLTALDAVTVSVVAIRAISRS